MTQTAPYGGGWRLAFVVWGATALAEDLKRGLELFAVSTTNATKSLRPTATSAI